MHEFMRDYRKNSYILTWQKQNVLKMIIFMVLFIFIFYLTIKKKTIIKFGILLLILITFIT